MADDAASSPPRISDIVVVTPNLKYRLSGVTTTLAQLIPLLSKHIGIAALGPGLPKTLPTIRWWQVLALLKRPKDGKKRIWHARRNTEMVLGIVVRLVAPVHVIFTSASQRVHKPFSKWLIGKMEAVIATSARTGSYLEVPYTVIRHGVDLERFRPPKNQAETFAATSLPGTKAIGCFGRVRHQKGTDLFVDSMIALLPKHPEWTAIVAGRTTAEHQGFEDELRARIGQAGLTERIRFIGEIWDVDTWYRRLSLYVAPSRTEGFGVTPLEAMASGVPVVASDAGAYTELIVEGETGAVVPTGDLAAFTSAIERFMADEPLRQRCAAQALEHMRTEFPISGEVAKLLAVYERVRA